METAFVSEHLRRQDRQVRHEREDTRKTGVIWLHMRLYSLAETHCRYHMCMYEQTKHAQGTKTLIEHRANAYAMAFHIYGYIVHETPPSYGRFWAPPRWCRGWGMTRCWCYRSRRTAFVSHRIHRTDRSMAIRGSHQPRTGSLVFRW